AKAKIWAEQPFHAIAIGNLDDPVVARHLEGAPARTVTFGLTEAADYRLVGDQLLLPGDEELARIGELHRAFPHDLANALAAAASAIHGGADASGARQALLAFRGLPHRVSLVGEAKGVRWYDDSKATAPHATGAAVRGFESVVLIAGGRNKGLDLSVLARDADQVRAVVGIGETGPEVVPAFD